MRVAIYARVSTQRQEQEETIESQIALIKEAISTEGYSLDDDDIYRDEGYSGSLLNRPALDELTEAVSEAKYDLVYVYDYGRISRELNNLITTKDSLERKGCKVVSLHEKVTGDDGMDRFIMQVLGAVHELDKKRIAKRFHNGKIQKAKRGEIVGYNAPYGYTYDKESGKFLVNVDEAKAVLQMFTWAKDGHSTYAIIDKLHKDGVMPKKQRSEYWTRGPIARILKNETYFGDHYYNKSEAILPTSKSSTKYRRVEKTGRKQRDRSEWILAKVSPIITKDLFDEARKQIAKNVIFNPKNRTHNYLLTSLIKCTCGANRNGDGPAGKKYYRCTSRHRYFDRLNRCRVGGLNVLVTDELVWQELGKVLSNKSELVKHAKRWLGAKKTEKTDNHLPKLKSSLRQLEIERERYLDGYGKGIIKELQYIKKSKEVDKKIDLLTIDIDKVSHNRGKTVNISPEELAIRAEKKLGKLTFEQRKKIIEQIVDRVIASPQEIKIWGHIPAPVLATAQGQVKHVSKYRNRWAAKCWQKHPF